MAGRTPNLDRWPREGMRFTDYYAEASCTAGRANFITGELPIRTGMTTVGQAGAPIGMPGEAIPSRPRSRRRATPPASSARTTWATSTSTCRRCTASTSSSATCTTWTRWRTRRTAFLRQAISIADDIEAGDDSQRAERDGHVCAALLNLSEQGSNDAESQRFDRQCSNWVRSPAGAASSDPFGYRLMALSRVALARSDSPRALALAREALALNRQPSTRLALNSIGLAEALLHVGRAQCSTNQTAAGIASLMEARRLLEVVAPRSGSYVQTLDALGRCERSRGRPRQGAELLERVLALADAQPQDGPRATFGGAFDHATRAATVTELTGALVDARAFAPAFDALERGRARGLRRVLAERAIDPSQASATESARRSDLWSRYDLAQRALQNIPATAPHGETTRRLGEIAFLSARMDALDTAERRSLLTAAVVRPTLEQIARLLPIGTVLFEYSGGIGPDPLFVIDRGTTRASLRVVTLPVTSRQLSGAVSSFRASVERPGTVSIEVARQQGAALYDMLLGPVDDIVARASRLIIVPDGPLFDLPFVALVRGSVRVLSS